MQIAPDERLPVITWLLLGVTHCLWTVSPDYRPCYPLRIEFGWVWLTLVDLCQALRRTPLLVVTDLLPVDLIYSVAGLVAGFLLPLPGRDGLLVVVVGLPTFQLNSSPVTGW